MHISKLVMLKLYYISIHLDILNTKTCMYLPSYVVCIFVILMLYGICKYNTAISILKPSLPKLITVICLMCFMDMFIQINWRYCRCTADSTWKPSLCEIIILVFITGQLLLLFMFPMFLGIYKWLPANLTFMTIHLNI